MSDLLNTFTSYEQQLVSDDIGQVVKALSEIKKLIKKTESKVLLNSIVSKTANNFEFTKNIRKYQYIEVIQSLH